MSTSTTYSITLYNHDQATETATGRGNTPRQALLTATLERHPEAASQWRYEDNPDGSGCLVCPDDERVFYQADPVLPDDSVDVPTSTLMVYRAITPKTAQWIGGAASVAGGYVATEEPRLFPWSLTVDDDFDVEDCRLGFLNGDLLAMRVPADAGLATEGRPIPDRVLVELRPELASAGYSVDADPTDAARENETKSDNVTIVADHCVQHDRSGVGHCWRDAGDLPENIAEEVACWIVEDDPKPGGEYRATNGQTYRLPPG